MKKNQLSFKEDLFMPIEIFIREKIKKIDLKYLRPC